MLVKPVVVCEQSKTREH